MKQSDEKTHSSLLNNQIDQARRGVHVDRKQACGTPCIRWKPRSSKMNVRVRKSTFQNESTPDNPNTDKYIVILPRSVTTSHHHHHFVRISVT